MKKLRLTFFTEQGKKYSITLQHVAQDLTPETVYNLMLRLIKLDLFEKDGIKLVTKICRACYVGKTVTELFSVEENSEGVEVLAVNPLVASENESESMQGTGIFHWFESFRDSIFNLKTGITEWFREHQPKKTILLC